MIHVEIDYDQLAAKLAEQLEHKVTPWLSKDEAAEYARVSVRTLERWMTDGLPYVQVDRRLLFNRREIDSWLTTNHRRS